MITDKDIIEIESILALADKKISGLLLKTATVNKTDKQSENLKTILQEIRSIHNHQREQFDTLRNG